MTEGGVVSTTGIHLSWKASLTKAVAVEEEGSRMERPGAPREKEPGDV